MKYTQEQKDEALELLNDGMTGKEVRAYTGIPESLLYKWRSERKLEKPRSYHRTSAKRDLQD